MTNHAQQLCEWHQGEPCVEPEGKLHFAIVKEVGDPEEEHSGPHESQYGVDGG